MTRTVLTLTLLLLGAVKASGGVEATRIPAGTPPTLDGTLAEGEWEDALTVQLAPGGEAFLKQDERALYVGLRVGQNCIPSLALHRDGTVLLLHASASLGTAAYESKGTSWQLTRPFTWHCRGGDALAEEKKRFLADEGWLATTVAQGRKGEAEYRIERRLLTGKTPTLALVACRLQPGRPTVCAWPATVDDGTKNQKLLFGHTPALDFNPATWALLDLGKALESPARAERFEAELDKLEAAAAETPVKAYVALLDLLDRNPDLQAGHRRATRLRRALEKRKPVAREAAAQRKLETALKVARRKLRELQERYAGTRAAQIAREKVTALEP